MLHAVADTHAVIWYLYDDRRLSAVARATFEEAVRLGGHIGFSAITLAEMIYLSERGRIHNAALPRLLTTLDRPDAVLQVIPFGRAVALAMLRIDRDQIPDLPDRIIAATAVHGRLPLISRDRQIILSDVPTIW